MSDRQREPGKAERGTRWWALVGVVAGVVGLALALIVVVLGERGDGGGLGDPAEFGAATTTGSTRPSAGSVTAPVTEGATAPGESAAVTGGATAVPSRTSSATPSPTGSPQPGSRGEATDADAAAFVGSFRPGGAGAAAQQVRTAVADTDGDGREEVVVASLVGGFSQIDVARWDGRSYRVAFTGQGGSAEVLEDLRVTDYTGDGVPEIVTVQATGGAGGSLSVYGWDGDAYVPQTAHGGCWDGSGTYGVLGARIGLREIVATCDDPNLPLAAQPSDVYVWDGRQWVFERREQR